MLSLVEECTGCERPELYLIQAMMCYANLIYWRIIRSFFFFFFLHTSDLIEVEINEIPVLFEVQTALSGEKLRLALASPKKKTLLHCLCLVRIANPPNSTHSMLLLPQTWEAKPGFNREHELKLLYEPNKIRLAFSHRHYGSSFNIQQKL